jgi:hypothetical protein
MALTTTQKLKPTWEQHQMEVSDMEDSSDGGTVVSSRPSSIAGSSDLGFLADTEREGGEEEVPFETDPPLEEFVLKEPRVRKQVEPKVAYWITASRKRRRAE